MRAVDTNVFVRLLIDDKSGQMEKARALLSSEAVFVPMTVILEAAWVLRSRYGRSNREAAEDIRDVVSLTTVNVERPERLTRALGWIDAGMDFADALHLAAAQEHDGLVTFDKEFARVARREGVKNVELL